MNTTTPLPVDKGAVQVMRDIDGDGNYIENNCLRCRAGIETQVDQETPCFPPGRDVSFDAHQFSLSAHRKETAADRRKLERWVRNSKP